MARAMRGGRRTKRPLQQDPDDGFPLMSTLGSTVEATERLGSGREPVVGHARTVLMIVYYAIAKDFLDWPRPLGRLGFRFRGFIASRLFAECGPRLRIHRRVSFGSGAQIHAANNVGIGQGCSFGGGAAVYLGAYLTMGPGCTFITGGHGVKSRRPLREQPNYHKPIRIGEDVFLGAQVLLLPGVTVGDGAIVGAGSVVSKDVEPYTIVAGNPIRVIGRRE